MGQNFLTGVDFKFSIQRLPHIQYYVQSVNIPGISMGFTPLTGPFRADSLPGDKIEFGDFSLEALVDEDFDAYIETFNWLHDLSLGGGHDEYRKLKESNLGLVSDATLTILNSSKRPSININFTNLFPTSMSDLQLDAKLTDTTSPTLNIVFRYTDYSIQKIT